MFATLRPAATDDSYRGRAARAPGSQTWPGTVAYASGCAHSNAKVEVHRPEQLEGLWRQCTCHSAWVTNLRANGLSQARHVRHGEDVEAQQGNRKRVSRRRLGRALRGCRTWLAGLFWSPWLWFRRPDGDWTPAGTANRLVAWNPFVIIYHRPAVLFDTRLYNAKFWRVVPRRSAVLVTPLNPRYGFCR